MYTVHCAVYSTVYSEQCIVVYTMYSGHYKMYLNKVQNPD